MPCFMLRSTFLHVHMFRSRCLGFLCHTFFFMFYASFSSRLMLGLHVRMFVWCYWLFFARIYVFICFLQCFMFRSTSVHAYMLGFMFFHVYVLGFYMYVSLPICLCICFQMPLCLDLCSLHALFYIPCSCALHAMFVCLDLGYICHAMCYCSPFVALSFFLVFWPIGLDPI